MDREKTRKIYIDAIKILAIYMVLFNHTGEKGFMLFTVARGSKFYWIYLFCSIFIKIAVPLFFMTSGALLLGKEETIKDILLKRFLKYVAILIIASLLSYVYKCIRLEPSEFSIPYFFTTLYTNRMTNAYWYLYVYLSYILAIPFLRKIANKLSQQEYVYMIFLYLGFKIIEIIDFMIWKGALTHNGLFNCFTIIDYVFYPLFGFFIDCKMNVKDEKKVLRRLLLLSLVSIVVCGILTHYKCNLLNEWREGPCQTFFNTLIFIPAGTVYLGIKLWFKTHNLNEKMKHIIIIVSQTTFGIFLFEQVWRRETEKIYEFAFPYVHSFFACLLWILCACILGVLVTLIVRALYVTIYGMICKMEEK